MPISGPSSYPATMREFLLHWEQVNDYLGVPTPLVLPGNVARDALNDWVGEMDARRNAVTDAAVERALARGGAGCGGGVDAGADGGF